MYAQEKSGIITNVLYPLALLLAAVFTLFIFLISQFNPLTVAQNSNVPIEYYTNYQVAVDFNEMNDVLSTLDAVIKVGQQPDTDLFVVLAKNFKVVFEFFPKSRPNTQVYKQCDLLVNELSLEYSIQTYTNFKKLCFDNVKNIVKEVQSSNTVKAKIIAKPAQGPSPLNVTLDARGSTDPSDDTIPEDNYFWYYKDINGVDTPIGRGPVMNYTFDDPGRYVVHLTVRSANNEEQGVFDGEDSIEAVVSPKTSDIVVYLNGKLLDEQSIMKIGTQDAQGGFSIDGTATTPLGGRTIIEHTWTITGNEQTNRHAELKTLKGPPSQFNTIFPYNGIYTLKLETIDNESNKVFEEYEVSVSDPVSLIKYSPSKGDTQTTYNFDASASYSLTSRVNKYQRSIVDPDGNQIETFESRELERGFKLPGMYTIKLTVFDDLKNSSFDLQRVYVESSAPVPSFIVEPLSDRLYPSQFVLDASGTQDIDVSNGVDFLTYHRSFSRPDVVDITSTVEDGEKILISFQDVGKHLVTLTIKDSFGKSVSVEKTIEVKSTLRPELLISPVTAQRGEQVTLIARNNKEIGLHSRSMGDGDNQTTEFPKITHSYDQAGIYEVELQVVTLDGSEENSIKRRVFVGQKDNPTINYLVKSKSSEYLQQDARCTVDGIDMPAFDVDRYEQITLDISDSIGVQGKSSKMEYYLQTDPDEDGTIYQKGQLSHEFRELGCQSILATVEDSEVGKFAQQMIRFSVKNALPTIDNLTITFPQLQTNQGLGIGIGLQQPKETTDLFSVSKFDPLLVRLSASGVRDPDANQVSRFVRYFYNTANPEDLIDVKVTPASVPYASFSVQRSPGEYAFGVRIIDSDDGEIDSTEVLGKGPVIFFPASDTNPDIPLVTLSVSSRTVQVGEEIVFTPTSSVLSNRSDFDSTRYYRYDVDGDGKNDSGKLKSDSFTYIYDTPGTYKPSVSVVYRDKLGKGFGGEVIVKQGVKPQVEADIYGPYALYLNTSIGKVEDQVFCADLTECGDGGLYRVDQFEEEENKLQIIKYLNPDTYTARLISKDEYGNKLPPFEKEILITDTGIGFGLMSIPKAQKIGDGYEISVGSNLNNTVYMYLAFDGTGKCIVDLNTSVDSDGDGDPQIDPDMKCNELNTLTFDDVGRTKNGRIYYVDNGLLTSHRLKISFLDEEEEEIDLPSRLLAPADELNTLISSMESGTVVIRDEYYLTLLYNLKDSLGVEPERLSVMLQLSSYIQRDSLQLPEDHLQKINIILLSLNNESSQGIFGANVYQQTKSSILNTYFKNQEGIRSEFIGYFDEYDEVNGRKDEMKKILDKMYTRLNQINQEGVLDEIDLNDIRRSLCNTIAYHELESKSCGIVSVEDEPQVQDNSEEEAVVGESSGSGFNSVLKRVLWGVGGILIFVIVLLVIFALKARSQQREIDGE